MIAVAGGGCQNRGLIGCINRHSKGCTQLSAKPAAEVRDHFNFIGKAQREIPFEVGLSFIFKNILKLSRLAGIGTVCQGYIIIKGCIGTVGSVFRIIIYPNKDFIHIRFICRIDMDCPMICRIRCSRLDRQGENKPGKHHAERQKDAQHPFSDMENRFCMYHKKHPHHLKKNTNPPASSGPAMPEVLSAYSKSLALKKLNKKNRFDV